MTVEQMTTAEPAVRLAGQLHLTADWTRNIAQISQLLGQVAPGVEAAAYWSLHGQPSYFTAKADAIFGGALSGLRRQDIVQSRTLVPWSGVDGGYAIAVAMDPSSL